MQFEMQKLWQAMMPGKQGRHHLRMLAQVLLLAVAGSLMLDHFNTRLSQPSAPQIYAGHAREKALTEIKQRFQHGVAMLNARQYDKATNDFHRVLELDPQMPEAHVNMGFALLGLQQYRAAADFFDSATMLRPQQANAYWGLAIAQERSGNLGDAVQTLHTFVHVSKVENEFVRKARAMLPEWEARFEQQRLGKLEPGAAQKAGKEK